MPIELFLFILWFDVYRNAQVSVHGFRKPGDSEDDTRNLVASIDPKKIKIVDTVWDHNLQSGGRVLASETDKAFSVIDADTDWCFYIQGDEVLHEDGYAEINEAMHRWKDDKRVDGG